MSIVRAGRSIVGFVVFSWSLNLPPTSAPRPSLWSCFFRPSSSLLSFVSVAVFGSCAWLHPHPHSLVAMIRPKTKNENQRVDLSTFGQTHAHEMNDGSDDERSGPGGERVQCQNM